MKGCKTVANDVKLNEFPDNFGLPAGVTCICVNQDWLFLDWGAGIVPAPSCILIKECSFIGADQFIFQPIRPS